ncbi:uncharacterized protein EDB91DRAFT_1281465 [Suillus paluster]|uniref:uncharacterized protein n=1 Tax=Suillus paluster TaxID=48578 RepID=UPI001B85F2CA|nr:uncharacterized protein EDB91DRAFT_1281465 [Suillus paluster]KAG1740779.1 hypothetical protein EDB91DRAFT_1281465 [Suillus paluster]
MYEDHDLGGPDIEVPNEDSESDEHTILSVTGHTACLIPQRSIANSIYPHTNSNSNAMEDHRRSVTSAAFATCSDATHNSRGVESNGSDWDREDECAKVGHDRESCTQGVTAFAYPHPDGSGRNVVFVDTPGFDDSVRTDYEVFKEIAAWLKKTYKERVTLSGILFFHRITESRMRGTPLRNLSVFKELCGTNALENVILTTTMWDEVPEHIRSQREQQLKTQFWQEMMSRDPEQPDSSLPLIRHGRSSSILTPQLLDPSNCKTNGRRRKGAFRNVGTSC